MFHYKSSILKFFPRDVKAVAFFGHCFFRHAEDKVPACLKNHELIHICQMRRDGMFNFYFDYFRSYIKLRWKGYSHNQAYVNIPYEVEAFRHQYDLDYVEENYAPYI